MKRLWMFVILIGVTGSVKAQDKPNVVIMLADNVGYGDIGAYGAGERSGECRLHELTSSLVRDCD